MYKCRSLEECLIRGRARSDRRLCCVCVYVQRYEQRLPGVTVKRVLLCFLAVGRYQQASTLVEYSAFGSNQAARGPVGLFSIVWVGRAELKVCGWGEQGEVLNLKSKISNRNTTGVSKKFLCCFVFLFFLFTVTMETNSVVQYHLEVGVRIKERHNKYIILVEIVTVGNTVYKIKFHNPLL